ncbi:hypothetical protein Tco_0110664 [Tanacetum coccineum]
MEQFTNNLFMITSFEYSPTPPKDESKGKGIATKENTLKELIPLKDDGGSAPKMPNLQQFNQLQNSKVSKDATMRIERNNQPLSLIVYEKIMLKKLGFGEWIKVHTLAYKNKGKANDILLKNLKGKFEWIKIRAGKLGIPPPPELSSFGLFPVEKKRKRSSKILKEVFVSKYIVVYGMHRNLVPPPGVEGSRGIVISEPELGIFFYNGKFDLVIQREEEFHLVTTAQLIRIQSAIQRDTLEEMFKKMELIIKARSDVAEARKIRPMKDSLSAKPQRATSYVFKLKTLSRKLKDHDIGTDSGIVSMGDVKFEDLFSNDAESPFDIESKIKMVKRFQPPPMDAEDQITFLGPVYDDMETDQNVFDVKIISGSLSILQEDTALDTADFNLVSIPEDTIESSEEAFADHLLDELDDFIRAKCSTLDASADKNVDSDPLGHLQESVPYLLAESLRVTLPNLLSESLKSAIPQIIAKSVKQTVKPMNRQFNAFNRLESTRFFMLQIELSKVLKTKMGTSIRMKV